MQEKLNKLLQALQGYHPQRIILFGSVARGEDDADSDLDVLVIKDTTDACFMAEQAAQKALKAFLMWQGQRFVPLHSVAQLAERCAQFDPDFAAHIPAGRILDQYYIPMRYPDALAPPAVPFESYT